MDALTRLALEAGAGDERALDRFVDLAYEQVWRLCASLVDEASAEDLSQETFLRAVRALAGFRAEASARTWLLSICRRTCMDELRVRTRRRRRDGALQALTAADKPVGADASEEPVVADLLARLEPDRRTAFVLTHVLGLTCEEAAEICECPSGTIRSRVARARSDLLSSVDGIGPGNRASRTRGSSSG